MSNHSIVLTVHNKEKLIKKVLKNIVKHTKQPYELIVVLDGCEDNSELIVRKFLNKSANKKIQHKILYADNVFETKANNIGLKECSGDYISIIQDDMLIKESEWNYNLIKPFQKYEDVFSVTALTSHNIGFIPPEGNQIEGQYYMLNFPDAIGKNNIKQPIPRDEFHIRLTSNRGPLMITHDYLEKLNYLDEAYSPQSWDEHDLNLRARSKYGMVTGFYPINWYSELSWGSTRDEKGKFKTWYIEAEFQNQKTFYNRHKELIQNRIVENRKI